MSGRPDTRTQDELLHDLLHGSPAEQKQALERLAAIGEAEALDAVVDHLREEPKETAGAALTALRVLATKYVPSDRYGLSEAVLPFLTSEDWVQRLSAARLLNTHPNDLVIGNLRDLVEEAQQRVYEERSNRFSPRRMLAERTLWESVLAFANCGRLSVLPDILDMLDDAYMRPIATRALGIIGSDTERPRLEELAEDKDVRVRDAAQWALGLMDERAAQFTVPPDQMPPPPPERLSSLYWAHRQLDASDHDLVQFLVVRVAIEHLLLDVFLADGRNPANCKIILRRQPGESPLGPDDEADDLGAWQYSWLGPSLEKVKPSNDTASSEHESNPRYRLTRPRKKGSTITITYPAALEYMPQGQVSFDCNFESYFGSGWIYHVSFGAEGWSFARGQQTWSS